MFKIDPAARRLITAIADTKRGRISAEAIRLAGGSGGSLVQAGILVPHATGRMAIDEDALDDTLRLLVEHPEDGRLGHLGAMSWQDETDPSARRQFALDFSTVAHRILSQIDCSLSKSPVPYLDSAALDFGTARLPGRAERVGIWVARGLSSSRRFEEFRNLVSKRPTSQLRVVVVVGSVMLPHLPAHELVALEDVVDHEDGLVADANILAARLRQGSSNNELVWVSGDGAALTVRGIRHTFTGVKQKMAVEFMARKWNEGDRVLPVALVLEEAGCSRSVRRLKDLFKDHPTWNEVIEESGSTCQLVV